MFFQDEDETSFAQEMTVPRSYSDGNLVRSVSWKENLKLNLNIFGLAGHQVNGCCWEIGLLSAAMAHAVAPPAIGQVLLSESKLSVNDSSLTVALETTNSGFDVLSLTLKGSLF